MPILDLGNNPISVSLAYPNGSSAIVVPVIGFDVKDSHLGSDGLSKTTGTLTIPASPLVPFLESFDPLENPARFARKCRVIITIENSAGAIIAHPRGRLRILKVPASPLGRAPELEIEVGCLLALKDLRKPPVDDSGVILGTSTTRTEIINRLAAKIYIGNLLDPIDEWPINYPIVTEQSYVATMGQLAWDAGYVLWIDNQERLRASKAVVKPPTPDLRIRIGVGEVEVSAIAPDETPVELVRASGIAPNVSPTENPSTVFAIAADEEFDPSEISSTVFLGFGTHQIITRTNSRQPRGRIFPVQFPGQDSLITASEEDTITLYDEEGEGLLRRKTTIIRQPRGVIFPTTNPGATDRIDSKEIIESYFYENDATVRIETKTYEPAALVLGTAPNYLGGNIRTYGMKLSEWVTQSWSKSGKGWVQSSKTRRYKPGETSRAETTYSSAGGSTPPAPERRDEANQGEETQFKGEVRFPPISGSILGEDDRDFDVSYPVSDAHCVAVANLEGALLHGRQSRLNWILPLSDRILTEYQPLMVIDWRSPSGVVTRHLTDGLAFIHNFVSGVVSGDSINLGQVRRVSPGITPGEGVNDPNEYLYPPFAESTSLSGLVQLTGSLLALGFSSSIPANLVGNVALTGSLTAGTVITPVVAGILGSMASETTATFALSVQDFVPGSTRTYVLNNDFNGLFQWLGTLGLTTSRLNPSSALPDGRGLSLVTFSSEDSFGMDVSRMTDRISSAVTTGNFANSWMQFDISRIGNRTLVCNYYTVRARNTGGGGGNHPTAFTFQGSNDATTWVDLDVRTGLTYTAATFYSYPVSGSTAYRYFRLIQTALNSSGNNRFALSEFEIYGVFT